MADDGQIFDARRSDPNEDQGTKFETYSSLNSETVVNLLAQVKMFASAPQSYRDACFDICDGRPDWMTTPGDLAESKRLHYVGPPAF